MSTQRNDAAGARWAAWAADPAAEPWPQVGALVWAVPGEPVPDDGRDWIDGRDPGPDYATPADWLALERTVRRGLALAALAGAAGLLARRLAR